MMYDLLNKARKDGLVALEADIEDPPRARFSRSMRPLLKTIIFVISFATPCAWPSAAAWNPSISIR